MNLLPYPGLPSPQDVRLTATARREGALLHLSWHLEDPEHQVALPATEPPERRFGLWEATCYEAFLTSPGAPRYWEINLSPGGPWNVFRFDGYRAGMADEPSLTTSPGQPRGATATLTLDTEPLGLATAPWRLALSAVTLDRAGQEAYWALAHPGQEPDFHHPDAFVLAL